MKLLLLTDGIYPFVIGGMQKHSYYLAKHLALAGHEVTLVHCMNGQRVLPTRQEVLEAMEMADTANLEILTFRFPKPGWYPGHYLKESYLYSRTIYDQLRSRLQQFDFIYAKGFCAWYFLQKKQSGEKMPPIGVKFHGYEMFQPPANLKSRFQNWLLKGPVQWNNVHADHVFSYGGKISAIIRKIGVTEGKIIEIPTGIESSWFRNTPAAPTKKMLQFVFVGRFERRKGVEELTAALTLLLPTADFQFHFVGPIPATRRIRSEKIIYHGSISSAEEIKKVLDTCQVLVVPSHSEGMPNVIMEGMARGLAIVATDVGAVSSVVDERNGWLIEAGSSAAIVDVVNRILQPTPDEIGEKRRASLMKIREFSWESIAGITSREIVRVLA